MLAYVAIAAGVLALLLVVTQLVLPPVFESKVEQRLTARGGTAHVELHAVPALRLLAHHGGEFELDGRGLDLPLDRKTSVFDGLDGFDSVRVKLADVVAGPFTVGRFALSRGHGQHTYTMTATGKTSVSRVSSYLTSGLPPLLSSALAGATRGVTGPAGSRPVAFSLDAELRSDGGAASLVRGSGSVAGIPTGPLAALLAQAVVSRL